MYDSKSNSSYGISNVSIVTSNNLNPLSSIHPAILVKIKKQAQVYQGAAEKCSLLWQALKKNDIAGFRLSQKVIEAIFQQFQNDLYNYTKISSLKEFMNIFDSDKDGFLNEDQQIKIFSYIKQRIQLVANNSLKIQAYSSFKTLMKQVRQLESYITKWQQHLRNKIHNQQINQYKRIGESRIDDFCFLFDQEFQNLSKIKLQRREVFEREALYQTQKLQQKLNKATQYLKIKPKKKIRQLQVQQKLVSLQERVEQALDYRRQLNQLEVAQKLRVDKLMLQNAQHQRENLRKKHEKGRSQLQIKLQELQFKLIIKMKKQFDILQKKNKLHQNQITRIQNLSAKWAIRKGTFQPELKRTKKLERKRNQILYDYKRAEKTVQDIKIQDENAGTSTIQSSHQKKSSSSKLTSKTILDGTTNFQIIKKNQSQLPVNKTPVNYHNMTAKLLKFLEPKKTQRMYTLCDLYDQNLEQRQIRQELNKSIQKAENERRRNFILSKII